jgi:ribose transport system substrate-binding protein
LAAGALLVAAACGCGLVGGDGGSGDSDAGGQVIKGDITFNDAQLSQLDAALKHALAGKDLSELNEAMVVNAAVDYWKAGEIGFKKGLDDLGIKGTYKPPSNGQLEEQLTIIRKLRAQGITGLSVSAIDPGALKDPIRSAKKAGVPVLAIDSPLPKEDGAALYLGTPNYTAGQKAGEAMKQALGSGGGHVVVLVGTLSAANAIQRIQGFTDALKGSGITIEKKLTDSMDAGTATSNALTAIQVDPDINGLYGVYSYDGAAAGNAVQATGKTGKIKVIADDSDPSTLSLIKAGVIQATVLQQPYQQGYTGAYLLAAFKVLGVDATMKIVKPYLEPDGTTLSSGVGLVTKANLADYQAKLTQMGIA